MEKKKLRVLFREERVKTIKENIIKMIYDNYADHELCVDSIADKFGYHPVYLSSLFRNLHGEGIRSLIERIRLEKAREFLIKGESVNSTSEKVGYNNAKSFTRAFKRKYGVVPSEVNKIG